MRTIKQKQTNIGVVTGPIGEAGNVSLTNLVNILGSLSDSIYIITGNEGAVLSAKHKEKIHLHKIYHKSGGNIFSRIINYSYTQLRIAYRLTRLATSVRLWVFIFGEALLLPALSARLLGSKVVLAYAGDIGKTGEAKKDPLHELPVFLRAINWTLSHRIIVYTERIIEEAGLQKHRRKISIAHEHFFDFDTFKILRSPLERNDLVGYIGRLDEEKGILNFLEAIPKALSEKIDVRFLIGGDGELRGKVEEYLATKNLGNGVDFVGWVHREELPDYLNRLRLLVLPSYTEGLPKIMLEAMACGTPVLATAVGAIPDVIRDEETGFIMEDNSPQCITRNVVRALAHPDLEQIAANARRLVQKEYTYEAAVEAYRNSLASIMPE